MAGIWRVVSQQEREELNAQGSFVRVVEVQFELASGTRGSVTMPARAYSPEAVHALVDEKARAMLAVDNLAG